MCIFTKKLHCVRVKHKQQGYILVSLMASLVILGLIAISEYMHLVKKQQLDRAKMAANNIIHVAYTIGDAIYEPMAMMTQNSTIPIYKEQVNKIAQQWHDALLGSGAGAITLNTFYENDKLSSVCELTRPLPSVNQSRTCIMANSSVHNSNLYCQCTNQQIKKFPFSNMNEPMNIVMQPLWGARDETPKSVLLRVPYPELGGERNTGLALKMLVSLKKNLIDTPKFTFAVCMGALRTPWNALRAFHCGSGDPSDPNNRGDVDSVAALDPNVANQFIYIDIARR